jgi:hypothetical protein
MANDNRGAIGRTTSLRLSVIAACPQSFFQKDPTSGITCNVALLTNFLVNPKFIKEFFNYAF